jgi:nicotinate-nucleotide--dimethylbenzimidazole phosphoribosyltransferase
MGIGNTTASAAVIAALTGRPAHKVTGRGTGIDDAMLEKKAGVVERACARLPSGADVATVLAEVGGLEIAALAGFIVGGASLSVPVVVDGVIAGAALLAAHADCPAVLPYVVAGHRSTEPGASAVLDHLGLDPVIDLGLRLGEGSGACLALGPLQAAALILREMATFESAGVSE